MSNKDENGVSRWWLREPVDHADAESDKGGDFVMHSDYRRVVDALKDELAGTIKVREAAFVQIARLKADRDGLVASLVKLFGWSDTSFVHAAEHVENAVNNLRADLATERADLARVRGQRDRFAKDIADLFFIDPDGVSKFYNDAVASRVLADFGLRIEGGEVKEIDG